MMKSIIKSLKSEFSSEYHLIEWVVFTFLGGAIYGASLYLYNVYYKFIVDQFPTFPNAVSTDPFVAHQQQQIIINLLLPSFLIFLIPLVLALLLTKWAPEKHIVPPSFIQVIGLSLFLVYFINSTLVPLAIIGLFFLGAYTYVCIMLQDGIIIWFVGRAGKNMNKYSLSINSNLENLKSIFSDDKYRKGLGLEKKYATTENGFIMKSPKSRIFLFMMEIKQEDQKIPKCFINILIYEKKKYNIQTNELTEEFLHRQLDVIKGILSRNVIDFSDADLSNTNSLVNHGLNSLKGITKHTDRLSSLGWIKVIIFVGILGTIGYLLYKGGSTEGVIGVIVMFLLYVVYETKDYRDKRSL